MTTEIKPQGQCEFGDLRLFVNANSFLFRFSGIVFHCRSYLPFGNRGKDKYKLQYTLNERWFEILVKWDIMYYII